MYRIKIQRFDARATESDVALPLRIETLGDVQDAATAEAWAAVCSEAEDVGEVWIEPTCWIN